MNSYYDFALKTEHDRKKFFYQILDKFNFQSINICIIGAERNLDKDSIFGDGWFSIYAGDYIKKFGGNLTVVDIDPNAIKNAEIILEDFRDIVTFITEDGVKFLEKNSSYFDLVYLDGGNSPDEMYEEYKRINRTKTVIFCDDFVSKGIRLNSDYVDRELLLCKGGHVMAWYDKVKENNKTFQIGGLSLEYIRENSNSAWRNERSVELALGKWFANKFSNDILEVGDVCCHYSFFKDWTIVDPYGPYSKAIRLSAEEVDYKNLNVLSISTLEHFNSQEYNNISDDLGIQVLEEITKKGKNYLITIPCGANYKLQDHIMNSNLSYTFLVRDNFRGETNNWHQSNDRNLFYENYGHFGYNLGWYGNALAILVVTDQIEII